MNPHYLIIANGSKLPAAQLKHLMQGRRIIALDGAMNYLETIGIQPDILLGDFDSIIDLETWREKNISIHHVPDQNSTDLAKAIDFCDAEGACEIHVCCATGDRWDHSLHNIFLLKRKYQKTRKLILHTELQTLIYLQNEKYKIIGKAGDVVGLFGFPQARVTSQGLKFELENIELKFAEQDSVANQLIADSAMLMVEGEVLLVAPKRRGCRAD